MTVIGLTGGIASGKTVVSEILAELGAAVIDADRVGHDALKHDAEIRRQVLNVFGSEILGDDGEIDRSKLGERVFGDAEARTRLNQVMHPRMHRIVEERIDSLRSQGVDVVVVEAALLIEANWTDLVDQVWVTVASEDTVVERLRTQKGLTDRQAAARIESQMPAGEKVKAADVVIHNDSDLDTLRREVERHWQRVLPGSNS